MNRKKLILIGAAAAVILGVGYYLASPLWRNKTANDSLPLAANLDTNARSRFDAEMDKMKDDTKTMADIMPAASTGVTAQGRFVEASHDVAGRALLVSTGDKKILRFEDFDTDNGPDLRIYLATDARASDFVDLGAMKANKGNINYDIPAGTDTAKYKYALVWCRAFRVLFSYAVLE